MFLTLEFREMFRNCEFLTLILCFHLFNKSVSLMIILISLLIKSCFNTLAYEKDADSRFPICIPIISFNTHPYGITTRMV